MRGFFFELVRLRERAVAILADLGFRPEVFDDDEIWVKTEFGKLRIYLSPYGLRHFRSRHPDKSLRSSRHCVLFFTSADEIAVVAAFIKEWLATLQKGADSEDIAASALQQVLRQRPDLLVTWDKTGDVADMEGRDFQLGLRGQRGILWVGLQVKSSVAARATTIERWKEEKRNGNGANHNGPKFLRRVISVPQEETREKRLAVTVERIVRDAEFVLSRPI